MVITHSVRLKSSLRAARALSAGASRGGGTLFPALFGFFFYVAGPINNLILFPVVVATIMKRSFAMNKESR